MPTPKNPYQVYLGTALARSGKALPTLQDRLTVAVGRKVGKVAAWFQSFVTALQLLFVPDHGCTINTDGQRR